MREIYRWIERQTAGSIDSRYIRMWGERRIEYEGKKITDLNLFGRVEKIRNIPVSSQLCSVQRRVPELIQVRYISTTVNLIRLKWAQKKQSARERERERVRVREKQREKETESERQSEREREREEWRESQIIRESKEDVLKLILQQISEYEVK